MSPSALLAALLEAGIRVHVAGDQIQLRGQAVVQGPDLVRLARANKPELLALFLALDELEARLARHDQPSRILRQEWADTVLELASDGHPLLSTATDALAATLVLARHRGEA